MNLSLPHPVPPAHLPKNNSPGFWIGATLWGISWGVAFNLDAAASTAWGRLLPLAGVSCLPLSIGLAELRSGYAWKNLAPGNRGVQRTTSPAKFFRSVIFHFLLAAIIAGYGVWLSLNP